MKDIFKYLSEYISFSRAETMEILSYLDILSNKENVPAEEIQINLNKIISKDLPHKLKRQELRKYLRKFCYPILTQQEEKFRKKARCVEKKIKNVKFLLPSNFEKNTIDIIIKCKSRDEFEKCLENINRYISEIYELEEITRCENLDL